MASPLDGIGLLMSFSRPDALVAGTRALAQSAASVFRNLRRERRAGKVIFNINQSGKGGYRVSQVYSTLRNSPGWSRKSRFTAIDDLPVSDFRDCSQVTEIFNQNR
jgi:hypothetical protein